MCKFKIWAATALTCLVFSAGACLAQEAPQQPDPAEQETPAPAKPVQRVNTVKSGKKQAAKPAKPVAVKPDAVPSKPIILGGFPLQLDRLNPQRLEATFVSKGPKVDGNPSDASWQKQPWLPMNEVWLGQKPTANDFTGRFKLLVTADSLYLLAHIIDDTLMDERPDPLEKYWDDDCLEIFLDPDASGGGHECNYNAWAYHIALDGKVADYGLDCKPHLYSHVFTRRKTAPLPTGGTESYWEVALSLHPAATTDEAAQQSKPLKLKPDQVIGFAVAYCDNDRSTERENFIGSVSIPGAQKNIGYKDAWSFGLLRFKK